MKITDENGKEHDLQEYLKYEYSFCTTSKEAVIHALEDRAWRCQTKLKSISGCGKFLDPEGWLNSEIRELGEIIQLVKSIKEVES